MLFNTTTGLLSGTPTAGDVGTHRGIVIWVSDGTAQTVLPPFDVTVTAPTANNRAPTIAGTPATSVTVNDQYTFTPITGFYLLDAAWQGQWDVFGDAFRHIILPALLLGYFSLAYISRMTRSFMLNELAQEYIVAARAKGLSETRIIWAHALRNAAVPLITVIALSYAGLLKARC